MISSQFTVPNSQKSPCRRRFWRWMKFNLVGAVGIAVQVGVLATLRSWLKVDYLLATGLAVEVAVIHNFFWHERFTWQDRPAGWLLRSLVRLAKFNVSNGGVSIVGNILVMRLLVGEFSLNYVVANMVGVVLCSLMNFLLGDKFVFSTEADPASIST